MGYIVLSIDNSPVKAIGPLDTDQAWWFFTFNNYKQPDPKKEPEIWQFKRQPEIFGKFQENLPEGILVQQFVQMM